MIKDTTKVTTYTVKHLKPEKATVIRVADARLPTEFGEFRIAGYRSLTSEEEFVAVFKGDLDEGADTIEANERLDLDVDLREYGQCVEILRDLGVKKVRLMSNNPEKIQAVRDGGIDLVERLPIEFEPSEDTIDYLNVKKLRMGHLLSLV